MYIQNKLNAQELKMINFKINNKSISFNKIYKSTNTVGGEVEIFQHSNGQCEATIEYFADHWKKHTFYTKQFANFEKAKNWAECNITQTVEFN
tara:strand:+ start:828 stop:1106 length:279 start_codon:yes stop_codon:yes gene_type:complete